MAKRNSYRRKVYGMTLQQRINQPTVKKKGIIETIEDLERDHEPTGWCPKCEVEIFHGAKTCELCGGKVEE